MLIRKRKIKKAAKSDKGSIETISFLVFFMLILQITITVLDVGIHFSNRTLITTAAQNGARVAAIYGGAGRTTISKKYGAKIQNSKCSRISNNGDVACAVIDEIDHGKTVRLKLNSVECNPQQTNKIGERTWCKVKYHYYGLPASSLGLWNRSGDNTVLMSAESEVILKQ